MAAATPAVAVLSPADQLKAGLSASYTFLSVQSVPIAIKLAAYPVERTRLLMQTQWVSSDKKGGFQTWAKAGLHMKSEGNIASPWRGFGPTIVRWWTYQYLNLFIKDKLTSKFPQFNRDTQYSLYFLSRVSSGAATGVAAALVWGYPLDVLRQNLATSSQGNWRVAAMNVYNTHGLRGFYRGFLMDAPGLAIFRGVQLGGWDIVKDLYGKSWNEKSTFDRFLHGQAISLLGSCCSYPYDTIRRSLIHINSNVKYSEVILKGVEAAGGYRRFLYAGFSARWVTSFVNGALLEFYDEWKRQTNRD